MEETFNEKTPDKQSYTLSYVTRNAANNTPSSTETTLIKEALLKKSSPSCIIVATQEESRETYAVLGPLKNLTNWLFGRKVTQSNNKQSLGAQLKNTLSETEEKSRWFSLSRHFDAMTGKNPFSRSSYGRVNQTFLSQDSNMQAKGSRHQHASKTYKTANKGGEYGTLTANGQTVESAAVHLDSKSYEARVNEAKIILQAMNQRIYSDKKSTKEKRIARATTPAFFGGDLNCRDLKDGDVNDTLNYLYIAGYVEANNDDETATYGGKNTHIVKKEITPFEAEKADEKRGLDKQGGKLDRVFFRGPIIESTDSVIEDTNKTSDHKAVVAIFSIQKNHPDDKAKFSASAKNIVQWLEGLNKSLPSAFAQKSELQNHINHINKQIFQTENTPENEAYLDNLFNVCETLEKAAWEAEILRAKARDAEAKAQKIQNIALSQDTKKGWLAGLKRIFHISSNNTQIKLDSLLNEVNTLNKKAHTAFLTVQLPNAPIPPEPKKINNDSTLEDYTSASRQSLDTNSEPTTPRPPNNSKIRLSSNSASFLAAPTEGSNTSHIDPEEVETSLAVAI